MFWHVDDLPATLEQLLAMGATEYEPLTARASGFSTASVIDPFGNILGVMHNPHYLALVGSPTREHNDLEVLPSAPELLFVRTFEVG